MDFITNTLFSFKNAKTGKELFVKANNESVLNFVSEKSRLLELNSFILLHTEDGEIEYQITRLEVFICGIPSAKSDAVPYSYQVHCDVVEAKDII